MESSSSLNFCKFVVKPLPFSIISSVFMFLWLNGGQAVKSLIWICSKCVDPSLGDGDKRTLISISSIMCCKVVESATTTTATGTVLHDILNIIQIYT